MKLLGGDSLYVLKELPDNSIDAVVTDPPYGLSFMGKKWDYDVPSADLWREVIRVMKPGAHLLSFGGTRTYHRMVVNIEDAGFEIRDQIQWIYGSGFPKSHNLKDEWAGWGTALKPANEPIVLARKPLSESTVAKNVERWGCGAINIDGTRIETIGKDREKHLAEWDRQQSIAAQEGRNSMSGGLGAIDLSCFAKEGRWPANVIFDEQASFLLDEMSGQFAGSIGRANRKSAGNYNASNYKVGVVTETEVKDFGGASRFFYCAKASKSERNKGLEGMNSKQVSHMITGSGKPSEPVKERKAEGEPNRFTATHQNHHPTVKPIKLMEYLIKLITPPNGIILDPFMGSGSTGVAAVKLGFDFVGIEMNEEYLEIARRRITNASE